MSLPLSAQPHMGVLCAWLNTHTMAVLHHGLYNFTVFFCFGNVWFYFILESKKKTTVHNKAQKRICWDIKINTALHYYKLTVVVSLSRSICKIQYTPQYYELHCHKAFTKSLSYYHTWLSML